MNNVVTTLILTTFLVLSLGSFAQAQTPTFSITISAAKRVFASGSEIRLEIVQTNTSDHDIVVTRGIADAEAAAGGFRVEVQDAKGNPPPETKFQRILKGEEQPTEPIIGSGIMRHLPPGKVWKAAMIVNRFYDLSKSGVYKIQVVRPDFATGGVLVRSNTMTVTVVP